MQTRKVVCKTMCNLICSIIHSLALQPPAQSPSPSLTQISYCSLLCYSGPLIPSAQAAYQSLLCLIDPGWLAGGWCQQETLPKHLVPF